MSKRKFWYVIALCTLCFIAARIAMAQQYQGQYPQQQGPPPGDDQGVPPGAQDQGPPPNEDESIPPAGQDQGQPLGAAAQPQGPPPGAARIGFINGEVSTMRGDSGEWVAGIVNAPVMEGDAVATAGRSRAEVQLDYASVLRLDQNTEVKIAGLTQRHIQLQVASGVIDFTLFKGAEADVEIDTPNMAVHPLSEGVYRIQVDADAQTQLTVRKGRAEVSTQDGSTTVDRGQVIYVRGEDNPEYQIADASSNDEWDRWNSDRDHEIDQARTWQYANRYYTGAQDLDSYGNWVSTPDYGYVWTPNVGPDWVPYYDGRWAWEPYWGWTWVSYEPWGWAPYHYGRWCYWGNRWCWSPGVGYWGPRPLWAPAYVSFLGFGFGGGGFGFGVGLGLGIGSIGWCPLGLFERAYPWWGYHNGYRAVNITNIVNVNNFNRGLRPLENGRMSNLQAAFGNPNIRRAITTMPADQFGKGMVRGFGRSVDLATLRQGRMLQGTLPVVPTRASLMPGNRLASPSAIPSRSVDNTRFFSRTPVTARPESFNQRAAQIQQMVRQNPAGTSNYGARPGANSMGRSGNQGGGGGGFGNANRPGYANPRSAAPNTQGQYGNSGWQRFASRPPGQSPRTFTNDSLNTLQPQSGSAGRSFPSRPTGPQQGGNQGGWQGYSRPSQPAPSRGGGWNAAAPRSQYSGPRWGQFSSRPGGAYGGYGSRPSLNMSKPIVVQRSTAPRAYGAGGYGYRAPSGGTRGSSSGGNSSHSEGGGGHSAPAVSHGGGGGGGGGSHGRR
jgi:hypothetical protein